MKFALYFGNRGFFPESVVADAREEMAKAVETQNFERAAAIRDEIKQLKGEN